MEIESIEGVQTRGRAYPVPSLRVTLLTRVVVCSIGTFSATLWTVSARRMGSMGMMGTDEEYAIEGVYIRVGHINTGCGDEKFDSGLRQRSQREYIRYWSWRTRFECPVNVIFSELNPVEIDDAIRWRWRGMDKGR